MDTVMKSLQSIGYFFQGVLEMIILTSYLTIFRLFPPDLNPFNTTPVLVWVLILLVIVDIAFKLKGRNISFIVGLVLAICPVILVVSAMPIHV